MPPPQKNSQRLIQMTASGNFPQKTKEKCVTGKVSNNSQSPMKQFHTEETFIFLKHWIILGCFKT